MSLNLKCDSVAAALAVLCSPEQQTDVKPESDANGLPAAPSPLVPAPSSSASPL